MMMSEFIERTGFEPTAEEYREIEEQYYEFDGDKDAFCKTWKKQSGIQRLTRARAEMIESLKAENLRTIQIYESQQKELIRQYEKLQKELDRELQWQDCDNCGTNMSQERFLQLNAQSDSQCLSLEEAIELVAQEFGFNPSKIRIKTEVSSYEVNKYRRLRKKESYTRQPVYNSSDWNYVRFDVVGSMTWMWEMVNGELRQYEC